MLILYPNYSLEIVGNYLAFPFQVVLLVSFKSNLFWLKFLHYEVFNVQRLFQGSPALSELLYCIAYQWFCQELFLTFRGAFSVHFHASHCLFFVVFVPACLPDSLIILPKILPLVNGFLHLFLPFFDFFFMWILRLSAGERPGRALPFANTCFIAFAERSPRTAEQRKYRRPAIHYNVWKPWIRIRIFAEIRLFSHSAHLSTGSMVYNS